MFLNMLVYNENKSLCSAADKYLISPMSLCQSHLSSQFAYVKEAEGVFLFDVQSMVQTCRAASEAEDSFGPMLMI